MLWHIFVVLLSHSLLAQVGMMVDHDSLHGDPPVVCLFGTRTFSSCVIVFFLVAGPLRIEVEVYHK